MRISKLLCVLILFSILFNAKAHANDSLEVAKAAQKFLNAFNKFDWKTFRNSFAVDATIFYPIWEHRERRVGKNEIETTWLELFPEFIDSANTRILTITPKDFIIQLYKKTAIVTFHLGDGMTVLSRRTIVFVKKKKEWKVVHLHASKSLKDTN